MAARRNVEEHFPYGWRNQFKSAAPLTTPRWYDKSRDSATPASQLHLTPPPVSPRAPIQADAHSPVPPSPAVQQSAPNKNAATSTPAELEIADLIALGIIMPPPSTLWFSPQRSRAPGPILGFTPTPPRLGGPVMASPRAHGQLAESSTLRLGQAASPALHVSTPADEYPSTPAAHTGTVVQASVVPGSSAKPRAALPPMPVMSNVTQGESTAEPVPFEFPDITPPASLPGSMRLIPVDLRGITPLPPNRSMAPERGTEPSLAEQPQLFQQQVARHVTSVADIDTLASETASATAAMTAALPPELQVAENTVVGLLHQVQALRKAAGEEALHRKEREKWAEAKAKWEADLAEVTARLRSATEIETELAALKHALVQCEREATQLREELASTRLQCTTAASDNHRLKIQVQWLQAALRTLEQESKYREMVIVPHALSVVSFTLLYERLNEVQSNEEITRQVMSLEEQNSWMHMELAMQQWKNATDMAVFRARENLQRQALLRSVDPLRADRDLMLRALRHQRREQRILREHMLENMWDDTADDTEGEFPAFIEDAENECRSAVDSFEADSRYDMAVEFLSGDTVTMPPPLVAHLLALLEPPLEREVSSVGATSPATGRLDSPADGTPSPRAGATSGLPFTSGSTDRFVRIRSTRAAPTATEHNRNDVLSRLKSLQQHIKDLAADNKRLTGDLRALRSLPRALGDAPVRPGATFPQQLPEREFRRLWRLFRALDENDSGELSLNEIKSGTILGPNGKAFDVATFRKLDKDRSGAVTFLEVLREWYPTVPLRTLESLFLEEELQKMKQTGLKQQPILFQNAAKPSPTNSAK
eukprot:TRINITY_DN9958_c0_g1_i1.p1 TRINITY_DN9958_c0_g1~~TRINITY_DN9958_c0_g1_i1.p1  ORF type:complete len:828 (+),score=146.73 TRINITY_DN9958_c0_g1_i1:58-2541(+)